MSQKENKNNTFENKKLQYFSFAMNIGPKLKIKLF